jgi:UDP-N-acetyl-D-mannosaminuronic acid dehydrogenase
MSHKFKTVCVVGMGYIGLPTAATLATRGMNVIGLEVSQDVVDTINRGMIHIVEPELDILVKGAVNAGKLRATTTPEPADAFVIAVPTPITSDNKPDTSYIHAAVESIVPVLEKGNLIILESTSPVGTIEKIVSQVADLRRDLNIPKSRNFAGDLYFVHCPERVLPGKIIGELVDNDRVIGGYTPDCASQAADLYSTFVRGKLLLTDDKTAEMTKLVENAYRDVNIAFANELSLICDELDINVWSLIEFANRHPRVNILQPGPGVGGHCIAVDPWFIVSASPTQARLIAMARQVNDSKPGFVVNKVLKVADKFKKPIIACLGLAFKADIDDLRESPAMEIVKHLAQKCFGQILVVEPFIERLPDSFPDGSAQLVSFNEALDRADIIVLLVDHKQFKAVDRERLQQKIVIDTKGCWR